MSGNNNHMIQYLISYDESQRVVGYAAGRAAVNFQSSNP